MGKRYKIACNTMPYTHTAEMKYAKGPAEMISKWWHSGWFSYFLYIFVSSMFSTIGIFYFCNWKIKHVFFLEYFSTAKSLARRDEQLLCSSFKTWCLLCAHTPLSWPQSAGLKTVFKQPPHPPGGNPVRCD